MGCRAAIAHALVVGALKEMIPIEQKETVRQMELSRLGSWMQTYFPAAKKGDAASAKVYLKVAAEHSKWAGLYADHGSGGVNIAVNNTVQSNAKHFGIAVNSITPMK
jgi:hypothetical protein